MGFFHTDVFDAVGVGVLVGRLERCWWRWLLIRGGGWSIDVLDGWQCAVGAVGSAEVLGVAGPAVLSVRRCLVIGWRRARGRWR